MIRNFCDRCGKEVHPDKGMAKTHPRMDLGDKEGPWHVTVKVWHAIGQSVGGIICEPCCHEVGEAMDRAAKEILALIVRKPAHQVGTPELTKRGKR